MKNLAMDEKEEKNETEGFLSESKDGGETANTTNVYEETYSDYMFLYSLFLLLQVVGIICIALAVVWAKVYMKGFAWDGGGENFNWHPVFMMCFIFLYANAAVMYRVLRKTEKHTAKLIHGGLNAAAFFFAVLGLIAVFRFHNVNKIPNMYSLHSWVGIATVSLYACQLVFGFLAFLFPRFSNDDIRRIYLGIHVYFGGVMLAMAVAAAATGITEKMLFTFKGVYSKFAPVAMVANFFGVAIALFVMIVGYILYNSNWKRSEKALHTQ